jgi:hypothetical protein
VIIWTFEIKTEENRGVSERKTKNGRTAGDGQGSPVLQRLATLGSPPK